MYVCVGNVAGLPPPPPLSLSLQSLGGRRDEREAEALIDTAPIDTPPEREIYTRLTTNGQTGGEEGEEKGKDPVRLTHALCMMWFKQS